MVPELLESSAEYSTAAFSQKKKRKTSNRINWREGQ